ncbi:MAG TPA: flagellar basal-body MS-ring/collar protein FliF [Candidatus Nanopelagicaceae bacterium]|nr:flagellar basal-body MS-ring/collar protein FliF [Candidatus Nanopelagicaceae bacterium]
MTGVLSTLLRRMRTTLDGFTPGQRTVTVLGVIALVLGGYLFTTWASKPAYVPLFSNLASTDANSIVQQLDTSGVPYQLTDGGATILVPQDKVYATRLTLSGQGLPTGGTSGYSLLDKQGITTSDFMQHVDYQRALEGELAKTISAIDGVQGAVVHLALPQQSVFTDTASKPTASVLVSLRPGVQLSPSQTEAVVNLVAASVPDLTPDAVTVADGSGQVLSGSQGGALDAAGTAREQQTLAFENQLSTSVQQMLNQVVGPNHSVVRVNASLDFDQRDTTTHTYVYDPTVPPLANTTTSEKYSGVGGPAVGGVLGATPGTTTGGTTAATGANGYDKTTQTVNNSVGSILEQRKGAPGSVKRLTVAVLLDSATASKISTSQVSQLVSNAVGLDTTRGDSIQVATMPFDKSAALAAKLTLAQADASQKQAGLFSLIRKGALGLLVLAILILALLSGRRARRTEVTADELAELEDIRRQLLLGRGEPAKLTIGGSPASGSMTPKLEMLRTQTADPVSELRLAARADISEMVDKQPDEVAQLLRGWLAERTR